MTKRLRTVPAHDWLLEKKLATPSSEMEALMMHDDDWSPRDESLWDQVADILEPEEIDVIELIVLGGWSYRQVAKELHMSVGKAHATKVRAFTKLAEALGERVRNGSDQGQ